MLGWLTRAAFDFLCSSRSLSMVRSLASRSSSGDGVGVRGMMSSVLSASAIREQWVWRRKCQGNLPRGPELELKRRRRTWESGHH